MDWLVGIIAIVAAILLIVLVIISVLFLTRTPTGLNGALCNFQTDCSTGLICVYTGSDFHHCRAGLGSSCATTTDCGPSLICRVDVPNGMLQCLPGVTEEVSKLEPVKIITDPNVAIVPHLTPHEGIPPYVPYLTPHKGIPPYVPPIYTDSSDTDTDFSTRDGIDVQSQESITPCLEMAGAIHAKDTTVLDAISYSKATLLLRSNGKISITEANSQRRTASNSVTLTRLSVFKGYLYGVGNDALLYSLADSHLQGEHWNWSRASWCTEKIAHISTPLDRSILWVQTLTSTGGIGYLYTEAGPTNTIYQMGAKKRVYGRDKDHYLELDQGTHTVLLYPEGTQQVGLFDAALNYDGTVAGIPLADYQTYQRVTIVDWKPYFIRRG